jgi:hypothetical protein
MSGEDRMAGMSVEFQWRYRALLALVGTPTLDGRLLSRADPGAQPRTRELPLPVRGYRRASRPGDGQGQQEPAQAVAFIESVALEDGRLMAAGWFRNTEWGRHYAGAMALDAVQLAVELDEVVMDQALPELAGKQDAAVFTDWRVMGALLVVDAVWPRRLVPLPEVWCERVERVDDLTGAGGR